MKAKLEICCYNLPSVIIANEVGANSLELCSNPAEGGVTSSLGFVIQALRITTIPIYVLVRPRGGHFVFEDEDMSCMIEDINALKKYNVAGFVTGALTAENKVHVPNTQKLMDACFPFPMRFHRAIDMCNNYADSVKTLVNLGVNSVLTSGGSASAVQGLNSLISIQQKFGDKIEIVAAGKINSSNMMEVLNGGINYLHGAILKSSEIQITTHINFNQESDSSSMKYKITDKNELLLMQKILNTWNSQR
jgi:copper homeostasis protein